MFKSTVRLFYQLNTLSNPSNTSFLLEPFLEPPTAVVHITIMNRWNTDYIRITRGNYAHETRLSIGQLLVDTFCVLFLQGDSILRNFSWKRNYFMKNMQIWSFQNPFALVMFVWTRFWPQVIFYFLLFQGLNQTPDILRIQDFHQFGSIVRTNLVDNFGSYLKERIPVHQLI